MDQIAAYSFTVRKTHNAVGSCPRLTSRGSHESCEIRHVSENGIGLPRLASELKCEATPRHSSPLSACLSFRRLGRAGTNL